MRKGGYYEFLKNQNSKCVRKTVLFVSRVWTYEDFQKVDYYMPASEESGVVWYREPKM